MLSTRCKKTCVNIVLLMKIYIIIINILIKKEDSMYEISVHIENNIMMIDASGDTYESSYVESEIKINLLPYVW